MRQWLFGVAVLAVGSAVGCSSGSSSPAKLQTYTTEVIPMADSTCYIKQVTLDDARRDWFAFTWWFVSGTTKQRVEIPSEHGDLTPLPDGSAVFCSKEREWRVKGVLVEEIKAGVAETPRASSVQTKAGFYFALLQVEKTKRKQDAEDFEQQIADLTPEEDEAYDRW
jgi:hypothetical protein